MTDSTTDVPTVKASPELNVLRHSSLATTQEHYIKDVPENTLQAMNWLEQLFDDC